MGGSGGGGGGPIIPPRPVSDSCISLDFTTNLEVTPGAPTHEPGTFLRVIPIISGPGRVFVASDDDGQHVGTIVERIDTLIRCTEQGNEYEAQVQAVDIFGVYTVRVRLAR